MNRIFTFLFVFISCISLAQTPAFPGAEGHGRYTTGGRGGAIYYVNSLEDTNTGNTSTKEGTLRWCLSQSGTRTILFKVSGTINLKSNLSISKGNVTIAGQTAPGGGICLAGYPVNVNASNVIIRYIRCRMGDLANPNADGADAMGGRFYKNIIVDHCSMSWCTDECVSFYGNEDFTLQWCIISESLRISKHTKGPHGYGGIWGGVNASFHHNLMAHHDSRNPRLGPSAQTSGREYTDMRNNVIYNWCGNSCYGAEGMNVNIVNCYYKPGPATPTGTKRGKIISIDKKTGIAAGKDFYNINDVWGKFYIAGNVIGATDANSVNATKDNWTYGVLNQFASQWSLTAAEKAALRMETPFDPGVVTTHTAEKAYEKVLDYAGASLCRDDIDTRITTETRNGTATYKGLSVYNGLNSVTYPSGTVIGSTTLTAETTINWKSSSYPQPGIIDSQSDLKPAGAGDDWSAWPTLVQGVAPADTDRDGIPDGWLDSNYPGKTASDTTAEGYTLVEVYINSLVADITVKQNEEGQSTGFSTIKTSAPKVKTFIDGNILNISSDSAIKKVAVYSMTGANMNIANKCAESKNLSLDVSALPSGVYIVRSLCEDSNVPSVNKILRK